MSFGNYMPDEVTLEDAIQVLNEAGITTGAQYEALLAVQPNTNQETK